MEDRGEIVHEDLEDFVVAFGCVMWCGRERRKGVCV